MTNNISLREWEALSAYLDGQLAQKDRQRLEGRLQSSNELRQGLEELRRTRAILRSQPKLRAPRNFTLTPEMIGKPAPTRPAPRAYPTFRLVSALASVLFVLVLIGDIFTRAPVMPTSNPAPAAAVMQEMPAATGAGERSAEPEASLMFAQPTQTGEQLEAQAESSIAAQEAPAAQAPSTKAVPDASDQGVEPVQGAPAGQSAVEDQAQPVGSSPVPFLSPGLLRLLEVGLAVLAVLAGLAALLLRRSAQ